MATSAVVHSLRILTPVGLQAVSVSRRETVLAGLGALLLLPVGSAQAGLLGGSDKNEVYTADTVSVSCSTCSLASFHRESKPRLLNTAILVEPIAGKGQERSRPAQGCQQQRRGVSRHQGQDHCMGGQVPQRSCLPRASLIQVQAEDVLARAASIFDICQHIACRSIVCSQHIYCDNVAVPCTFVCHG